MVITESPFLRSGELEKQKAVRIQKSGTRGTFLESKKWKWGNPTWWWLMACTFATWCGASNQFHSLSKSTIHLAWSLFLDCWYIPVEKENIGHIVSWFFPNLANSNRVLSGERCTSAFGVGYLSSNFPTLTHLDSRSRSEDPLIFLARSRSSLW